MKKYLVYSYDPPTKKQIAWMEQHDFRLDGRQRKVGDFDDRAAAERAAWNTFAAGTVASVQVLPGSLQVYLIDREEIDAGAAAPIDWIDPEQVAADKPRTGQRGGPGETVSDGFVKALAAKGLVISDRLAQRELFVDRDLIETILRIAQDLEDELCSQDAEHRALVQEYARAMLDMADGDDEPPTGPIVTGPIPSGQWRLAAILDSPPVDGEARRP